MQKMVAFTRRVLFVFVQRSKKVEIIIANEQNCTYLLNAHIRHKSDLSNFFVAEAKINPQLFCLPSDPSHHSQQWKQNCLASSNTDWQVHLCYWLNYVSLQKKRERDKSAFDKGECRVSALSPLRGQLHWSLRLYRPSWSQNWTPNYLFDPFMKVTLL